MAFNAAVVARLVLVSTAAALSAGTLAACAWLISGFWLLFQGEGNPDFWWYILASLAVLQTLLASAPALWLTAQLGTPHLRIVMTFAILNWLWSCVGVWGKLLRGVPTHFFSMAQAHADWGSNDEMLALFAFISSAATQAVMSITAYLVFSRFLALEAHAMRPLGFRSMLTIFWIDVGILFFSSVPMVPVALLPAGTARDALSLLRTASMIASYLPVLPVLAFFLWKARCAVKLMEAAAAAAPPRSAPWAKRARLALHTELRCILAIVLTTGLNLLVWNPTLSWVTGPLHGDSERFLWLSQVLGALLDTCCNGYFTLSMSGAFSMKGSRQRLRLAQQRQRRWQEAKQRWRKRLVGEDTQAWDEKVHELASRGISLSALLSFYKELPTRMPHWDSEAHTTEDVVRQAIIPLSEPGKCAGASILMKGRPTLPEKMVTHAWCNLFRDLLAAIVADALEEGEFASFAKLMDRDMHRLEDWVSQAGVGSRTYWICAFAVNQHTGICGSNHMRRDTVTGEACPKCNCGLPKAWNDTAPLLQDGRSVPCEMNKFDDMMRWLSTRNASFAQVVPIDAKFVTFNRAWCIAELATANEAGMVQDLKIRSADDLAAHEQKLHGLRIQDMQASRAEDKEAILESIPDHDGFNSFVQRMIFEDLLPSWSHLDGLERMAVAGCIMRWYPTCVWAPDVPSAKIHENEADVIARV